MIEPSLHALVCDLLGEDPDAPLRPSVDQALARCGPGQVAAARDGDLDVAVVVLSDGRAFLVPDRCPHGNARLSDGFVHGDRLVCPRHGWEFELGAGCAATRGRPLVRAEALVRRAG